MESKIQLPVAYKPNNKNVKTFSKIERKLKSLQKTGSQKILNFRGSLEVESMFYLYLFKKYKSNCFIHDAISKSRILGISVDIKLEYNASEKTEIINHLDMVSKLFVECIQRDTKIIIIPVTLRFSDNIGGGHANVLIYRKNLNQLEHFEPHGKYFSRQNHFLDETIQNWFKYFVSKTNKQLHVIKRPGIKFIESSEVCPYIDGLQNLEHTSKLAIVVDVEPIGYCAAWSMFFTELCLKNPEIPSSTLMNYIFNSLNSMNDTEKRDYLKGVIRGYAVFVNEKINKYFSMFDNSGLSIKTISSFSKRRLQDFRQIIKYLIVLEINLLTNPFYVKDTIQGLNVRLNELFNDLDINNKQIMKEIDYLSGIKNVFNKYDKFNVFSEPSQSSKLDNVFVPVKIEHVKVEEGMSIKVCPEGKELNVKTGRCVKSKVKTVKVKEPKVKTVTVKEPKVKTVKVKEPKVKVCPEGKELNVKTGRCVKVKTQKVKIVKVKESKVKVCPEGKELNVKTGRCVKVKTQKVKIVKVKESKVKVCPEDKELNVKTGRCVKVKTQKNMKPKLN